MARSKVIEDTPDNSAPVVAYRVSELEKTVDKGFTALHLKLDELKDGFVPHSQFADAIKQAETVHDGFDKRLRVLENWNVWLQRLVIGAIILSILAALLGNRFNIGTH